MSEFPLRVAILISGGGTTLKNLIELVQEGELNIEICVVISSSPKAGGIAFSKEAGIPTHVVQRKSCAVARGVSRRHLQRVPGVQSAARRDGRLPETFVDSSGFRRTRVEYSSITDSSFLRARVLWSTRA